MVLRNCIVSVNLIRESPFDSTCFLYW